MGSKQKTKIKQKWELSVSYKDIDYFEIDVYVIEIKLDKLAQKHGGSEYGTGLGFGRRDLHYGGFSSKETALKCYQDMKKVRGAPVLRRESIEKEDDE